MSLAVGLTVLTAISLRLTRPISEVTSRIEEIIQENEFSRPIDIDRSDEIGHLARRFNYMAATLLSAQRSLTEYASVTVLARNRAAAGHRETLEVLGRASQYRDNETASHVARVGYYAQELGSLVGLDSTALELLLFGAPLHDVGKIGIADSILFKPGPLTDDEFTIVKSHTTIGAAILADSRSEYLRTGAAIALYHHEWFDGTGYPNGVVGTDIPMFARIVAIVDTFDAVTTDRPYKKAWSFDRAMTLMREESGSHLDPDLVDLFVGNADKIRAIMDSIPNQS